MEIIRHKPFDIIEFCPEIYHDKRGFFFESFNREIADVIGSIDFVQDNQSFSRKNVLRGLHYQIKRPQGKLIRSMVGTVFDVAVDLRKSSPTFGKWFGIFLSDVTKRQLWIPPGYAHGFWVVSRKAIIFYKVTDYYYQEYDRCLAWDDPNINIGWPDSRSMKPILSEKDSDGTRFKDAGVYL